jgi:type IV secretion/conjugal transfer VirB4 family ATPase
LELRHQTSTAGIDKTASYLFTPPKHLASFQVSCREWEDALAGVLRLQRLQEAPWGEGSASLRSDLLRHLQLAITGLDHPIRVPPIPLYLDAVLGGQDLLGGFQPRLGEYWLVPVAIDGYPPDSLPGSLDFLNRLPFPHRWSTRFIALDPVDAQRALDKYRAKWWQKRKSLASLLKEAVGGTATHINADADLMAGDAVSALAEASGGTVRYGYYTSVVILMDPDRQRVREWAQQVQKALAQHGFSGRMETVNALEAWLGSLPGHAYPNVRRPLVHTLNLADLLPTTSIWAGPDTHPCPFYPPQSPPLLYAATAGATPLRVVLHSGDNGHTLLVGPSGAGKSTLLGLLAASHFRYPRAQVFWFDKGFSAFVLGHAAGGRHYEIAGESGALAFYPLARVDVPAERQWAEEWLEILLQLQGVSLTPERRKTLHRAVGNLAASPSRTLTDLLHTLQDQTLRDALAHYSLAGAMGRLLDAEADGLGPDDPLQVFELEHFLGLGDQNVVPVLLYLFHRIEQRLDGRPTLILLDEAWLLLSQPLFRDQINKWLRVLRKANAAVVFATQSLSDVMNSPLRDVILGNCPTKILLPNPEADTDGLRSYYQALGLNERQLELLATLTPKRHYYLLSPEGRRVFDLGLGPVELAFIGAGGKDDIALARQFIAQYGERWPEQWLRQRGLDGAADYWRSCQPPQVKSPRADPAGLSMRA